MSNLEDPILGIINFAGAVFLLAAPFVEKNLVFVLALSVVILLQGFFSLRNKKPISTIKGWIKIIVAITIASTLLFILPHPLYIVIGLLLLVVALYEIFPVIIDK